MTTLTIRQARNWLLAAAGCCVIAVSAGGCGSDQSSGSTPAATGPLPSADYNRLIQSVGTVNEWAISDASTRCDPAQLSKDDPRTDVRFQQIACLRAYYQVFLDDARSSVQLARSLSSGDTTCDAALQGYAEQTTELLRQVDRRRSYFAATEKRVLRDAPKRYWYPGTLQPEPSLLASERDQQSDHMTGDGRLSGQLTAC